MLFGNDKDYVLNIIIRFYELEKSDMLDFLQVYQYNFVIVYGTQYKLGVNNFLLVVLDEIGLLQFGKLFKIWFVSYNKFIFVVMFMNIGFFCERLNVFEILELEMV